MRRAWASEVSLLVLAGGAAAYALPWYAILTLPILFAADGLFMSAAYRWAFLQPVRKVFYNLTVTALSVAVALVIGLVAVFVATWLVALAVWRFGRIEQRWTADTVERQPVSSD